MKFSSSPWQGARLAPAALVILLGTLLWFAPHPEKLSDESWHLFTIFLTTIISIILKPLPLTPTVLIALTVTLATKASSFETMEWDRVREHIALHGMRNSNVMAIAPTATISYIQGCSQSIEPDYSVLFVYSTLSGEFTIINEHFVKMAKKKNIWCQQLVDALKAADGDVMAIDLDEEIQQRFKSAFDVDSHTLISAAAERQKWIDMGQSFNLYNKGTSLKYLNDMYLDCWEQGLKTTYYLRSKSATRVEKSTVEEPEAQIEEDLSQVKACLITDPDCESCQ